MSTPSAPRVLASLDAAAVDAALEQARQDAHGRHAGLLLRDGPLRQVLVALTAGSRLADHNAPPAATVHVLRGSIRIMPAATPEAAGPESTGAETTGAEPAGAEPAGTEPAGAELALVAGQLAVLPQTRHGVAADEDSAFLLSTVTGID